MNRPMRRYYHRLSRELGYGHPNQMLADMSSIEIADHLAYNNVEFVGQDREDYKWACLMTMTYNCHKGKNDTTLSVKKVLEMLDRRGVPEEQTVDEMWSSLEALRRD